MHRHVLISAAINAVLSAAFFMIVFGLSPRPLHWGAPDRLAFDFLPQSAIVALMSALVPVLVARRDMIAQGILGLPSPPTIILRAFGFAFGGLLLGALLAWLTFTGGSTIDGMPALALKVLYGGLLGAAITPLALKRIVA